MTPPPILMQGLRALRNFCESSSGASIARGVILVQHGVSAGVLMMCRARELQTGDEKTRESSKRKWFEDLKKAKEQELEKLGLDPSQVRRSFLEPGWGRLSGSPY